VLLTERVIILALCKKLYNRSVQEIVIWDKVGLKVQRVVDIANTDLKQTFLPCCVSPDQRFLFYLRNCSEIYIINLITL
jgi:hypothetical protein